MWTVCTPAECPDDLLVDYEWRTGRGKQQQDSASSSIAIIVISLSYYYY